MMHLGIIAIGVGNFNREATEMQLIATKQPIAIHSMTVTVAAVSVYVCVFACTNVRISCVFFLRKITKKEKKQSRLRFSMQLED